MSMRLVPVGSVYHPFCPQVRLEPHGRGANQEKENFMNTEIVKTLDNTDVPAMYCEGTWSDIEPQETPMAVDFTRICDDFKEWLDLCRKNGHAAAHEYMQEMGFAELYRAVNQADFERDYWIVGNRVSIHPECYIDAFFEDRFGDDLTGLFKCDITNSLVTAWLRGWEEGLLALWNDFQECALGRREAESQDSADASESE